MKARVRTLSYVRMRSQARAWERTYWRLRLSSNRTRAFKIAQPVTAAQKKWLESPRTCSQRSSHFDGTTCVRSLTMVYFISTRHGRRTQSNVHLYINRSVAYHEMVAQAPGVIDSQS